MTAVVLEYCLSAVVQPPPPLPPTTDNESSSHRNVVILVYRPGSRYKPVKKELQMQVCVHLSYLLFA